VIAARMPMTTITTRSSTIVKPELECGIWLLAIGETARALKRFFNLLERERERERERDCFFHLLFYYS